MLYDIQRVEDHALKTDLVSSSKRRVYARVKELNSPARRQQCRVVDQQGNILSDREIHDMR